MTYLYAGQNDIVSVADTEPEFGPANTRLSPADPSLTQEETDNAFGSNLSPAVTVASTRATYDDGVKPGTSNSLEFPISIISPVPQGHFVRGQGKRKVKPVKGHWLLTSTPNMEEVIAKNRPKDPPEKKKMQVKKVLFDNGKSNIKKNSQSQRGSVKLFKVWNPAPMPIFSPKTMMTKTAHASIAMIYIRGLNQEKAG